MYSLLTSTIRVTVKNFIELTCIHLTERKPRARNIPHQDIEVEGEHPQFCIRIHKETNLDRQIVSDALLPGRYLVDKYVLGFCVVLNYLIYK